ncbi:acyl-CoA N-acyltransferase [Whalleya microplaca]|nr:acyl-CoA N-acyltransferase [Whalleya microplaca]
MPLKLQPATEADARRAVEIEADAYAPNPFNRVLFPGPFPPEARDCRVKEISEQLRDDKTTRWLKVVDTNLDGEQMIAFAKWHIYTEKPQPTPRAFGPGCNVEACELLFGGIANQRANILREKAEYVFLHLLHTDPQHQGRGAATLLVKWVMEEAKKLGLVAYLESSQAGHSLYKKCGFRDVECLSVDMSKWGATEKHYTWSMIYDTFEST